MANKTIAIGSVVTATVAIALGIMTWAGGTRNPAATDRVSDKLAIGAVPEVAALPPPQLSRVRLLVSNLN